MNWPMYILAALIVSGFFGLIGILLFHAIPEGSADATFMLFGTLSTCFAAIVSYFFGSSKGSADKTATMVSMKK